MRYKNKYKAFLRIKALSAAISACCVIFASCGSQDTLPYRQTESVTSVCGTSQEEITESTEASVSGTSVPVSEVNPASDTSASGCETAASATPQSSSESVPPQESSSDTYGTASAAGVSKPSAASSEPPAVSSGTSGTTASEPAEIIIPDVKKVSSPGTKVLSSEKALVDYSNASLGYISAAYTGSSAKAKLRLVKGDEKYDHNLDAGGTVEYFPLSMGSGEYAVQIFEQADGKMYNGVLDEKISVTIENDVDMFLYPNKYVDFSQDSEAVKKSAEVCAGKDGTIEKLAAVFGYITSAVTYDKQLAATVKSGYVPDPDSVLSKKTGICFDYASLFAAMARAQGIPTRLVIGYASPDIYHAWNEVYTSETGWITVELFLKNNGYNLLDPTFYAGAEDKKQIAEYISDNKNYSPVYYY